MNTGGGQSQRRSLDVRFGQVRLGYSLYSRYILECPRLKVELLSEWSQSEFLFLSEAAKGMSTP